MIELIKDIDTSLFLFFNGLHNHFFDVLMYWVAGKYTWIPFYLLLLFFVYRKFKNQTWLILLAILVLITLSDQLSVRMFKEFFQRYRPCHNLIIQQQVHIVGNCGGMYGFVSSHASNTFALAVFLSLIFRQRAKNIFYVLIGWAVLVSYSRIYNGVHYPADVVVGALFGGLLGWLIYFIYNYSTSNFKNNLNKSIEAINKAGVKLQKRTRANYATYGLYAYMNKESNFKNQSDELKEISVTEMEKIVNAWKDDLQDDYIITLKAMNYLASRATKIYLDPVPSTFFFYKSNAENIVVRWTCEVHLE